MKGVMIQGTASDVGKSFITTAFCRLFAQEEAKVTPFKSQNMTNKTIIIDGGEIGKSQFIQALAAKTEPSVWMNPIVYKPSEKLQSKRIVLGKIQHPVAEKTPTPFYEIGLSVIQKSLQRLNKIYDVVVIEGAGSPVELNLKAQEMVNMKVAELADVPVILVADIDKGGAFASIVGTLELLTTSERSRVQGIIINKFRGDVALFTEGIRLLEEKINVPVLGVIPFYDDIKEDAFLISVSRYDDKKNQKLDSLATFVKENLNWKLVKQMMEQWKKQ